MSYWLRAWGPPGRPTPQPSCNEIVPELVIGEYLLPSDAPWLARDLRINAVLSLQHDSDLVAKNLSLTALAQAFSSHGIMFHRIPVADGANQELLRALTPAVEWISQRAAEGCRVYLHCNAGINRAPTVAIAYLQASRKLSLEAARTWVQERRTCVPYLAVLRLWGGGACP
ncbi:MAG: dual specificity protein phosphatase family protein [Candidatus Binatia bacterium]|nr:dual specificity protein phosphatase family protein [Candidatus Binatia bacterium]